MKMRRVLVPLILFFFFVVVVDRDENRIDLILCVSGGVCVCVSMIEYYFTPYEAKLLEK